MYPALTSLDPGSDTLLPVEAVVVTVGTMWIVAAFRRATAREAHARVAVTGEGVWSGVVSQGDLVWLIPGLKIGIARRMLMNKNVPVSLELSPSGMTLRPSGWMLRYARDRGWAVPWSDIVGATNGKATYRAFDGTYSVVPLTELRITVVGRSAQDFFDWWLLDDADDDEEGLPPTAQEQAEDAEWRAIAREELGPHWIPRTALVRVRTSAPDNFVDAVARWARGNRPVDDRAESDPR